MVIGAYSCIAKIRVSLSDSLEAFVRLVNATRYNYTMNLLSLLTDAYIATYDYATVV